MIIRELQVRYVGNGRAIDVISSSRDVVKFAVNKLNMKDLPQEHFYIIPLDAKNHPLGWSLTSKGSTSHCVVEIPEIFRALILVNASGFVAIHNHPSGDESPSPEDIALTERIISAGKIIGIKLVDHVIIGDPEYFSFLDAGLIKDGS